MVNTNYKIRRIATFEDTFNREQFTAREIPPTLPSIPEKNGPVSEKLPFMKNMDKGNVTITKVPIVRVFSYLLFP